MRTLLLFTITICSISILSATPIKINENSPFKFLELYGYFAFNHKIAHNLHLNGNNPYLLQTGLYDYNADEEKWERDNESNLSWAHVKLHLQPVINVAETMKVHSSFSLFGDRILGSDNRFGSVSEYTDSNDPDKSHYVVSGAVKNTHLRNRDDNPLQFEGLWASVETILGELSVGRMPFHWGLGILYNDGNSIFSETSGDYVDRVQLTVPFGDFRVIPAFDFNSEGIMTEYNYQYIDYSQNDDAWKVTLMFVKKEDDPVVLEEKLSRETTYFEFGFHGSYAWQKNVSLINTKTNINNSIEDSYSSHSDNIFDESIVNNETAYTTLKVDSKIYTWDLWFDLYYKNLSFKFEGVATRGNLGNLYASNGKRHGIDYNTFAIATETEYRFIPNIFHISLLAGLASKDGADKVIADAANMPGNAINPNNNRDIAVENFRFNKDYSIDSLIWNEILGQFTSGFYTSAALQYFFNSYLSIRSGTTYSAAWDENNTLSGKSKHLAVEPFAGLLYSDSNGLRGGLAYQIAFPLDGLDSPDKNSDLVYILHSYLGFVF